MAKALYIGDTNSIARKLAKGYIGDENGIARKLVKGYIGDENGIARLIFAGFDISILQDFDYIENDDGTFTLTAWKGTYKGKDSTIMVTPDSELVIVQV